MVDISNGGDGAGLAIPVRVRDWTFSAALPFWLERGFDGVHGGCVEALDFDGADAGVAFKRTRVACRQIYVFSHAALLGWRDGLDQAHAAARWLQARAWRGDEAGFVRRLTREGQTLDPVIDLYDNAFAIFAFSYLHRATGDAWALERARATLRAVRRTLAHPTGAGYRNDETGEGHRAQNPHMHLMEACLAAVEAGGGAEFEAEAASLADLCTTRFCDGRTLAEFFTQDWARAPGDAGRLIEPGHQFEWAWILAQHQKLGGGDHRATISALIDFGERYGIDPASGATFNAVRDDGAPLDRASRTWPNTERIKAAVAAVETLGQADARANADAAAGVLLERYLAVEPAGTWIDLFDVDGRPAAANVPTSSLYHVFLAFAEYLRLWR
jgi:N-acylglucosamine 2-epimerase/mannose-6-phosphate isomerase